MRLPCWLDLSESRYAFDPATREKVLSAGRSLPGQASVEAAARPSELCCNGIDGFETIVSHNISERGLQARLTRYAIKELREQRERDQAEVNLCKQIVAFWNERAASGRRPNCYPTFATVIAADTPILEVLCPACRRIGEVDVRTLDRHPQASISSLIQMLSCQACCPHPPHAILIGLKPAPRR